MWSSLREPYIVFGPSVPRHAPFAVHSMAAHAVPLARVSRIATRLKVFATVFISVLPPLYRIRLLTPLFQALRGRRPATGAGEPARAPGEGYQDGRERLYAGSWMRERSDHHYHHHEQDV